MNKISKTEAKKEIEEFFENIKDKSSREIKKIKKLSMKHNIKLGNLRKKFCQKCYSPYKNPETRIKKSMKIIVCNNCKNISRWKIK